MGDAKVYPETNHVNSNGFSIVELETDSKNSEIENEGKHPEIETERENVGIENSETLLKPERPDAPEKSDHECNEECKKKFPVHWAAKESDIETFKNLLQKTSNDLTELDCVGATVLIAIVSRDDTEWRDAVEDLVEEFLKYVTVVGKLDTAEKISEFVNIRKPLGEKKTALHYAADMLSKSLVELLLSYGSDASIQDSYGSTPLHCVVSSEKDKDAYDCAEMLLDAMENKDIFNTIGRTPLEEAVFVGVYEDMIQLLIDKGCASRPVKIDKDTGEETRVLILHTGVHYVYDEDETNIACLRTFLKCLTAEDINAKYTGDAEAIWKGRTALHVAAYNLFPNVLQCLLDHEHIDVFAVDDDGRHALHIIADFGYNTKTSEFVDILLGSKKLQNEDKERLFNMTDSAGETALDITIRRDSTALSRAILLQNPNYPDEWMTKDLFEKIYYKVPESMLPIMDQYINFDNKNYEANDEVFEASIGPVTFFDNNPYEDDYPPKLSRETDYLSVMLDSSFVKWDEMETVMDHPVVQLFIREKWRKLRPLFWFGMIFKVIVIIIYLAFIIDVFWVTYPYPQKITTANETTKSTNDSQSEQNSEDGKYLLAWQYVMGCWIVGSTVLMFIVTKMVSLMTVGFKKTISAIFLAHFIFTCCVCITIISACIWGVEDWHYAATAESVILASFIGMWECRDIPVIGIYADVFFTAFKNLIRLMIAFIPLLIGFCIAISLMLRGNKSFEDLNSNGIKILVMMLGEINFSDIFNSSDYTAPFPVLAVLIVALFVISVPIVMFNLLLGFTISDVQALEAASEMTVLISTLEQIILWERIVLSLAAQKLFPKSLLWRYLVERKEWTPECQRFGRKCALKLVMGDIPRKIRIKIREIARSRPIKKPIQQITTASNQRN